jgi:hypothetical protein
MDFFTMSHGDKTRIYYDASGKPIAVVVTYLMAEDSQLERDDVLWNAIAVASDECASSPAENGQRGFWITHSCTTGDAPYLFVTERKLEV